MIEKYCDFNFTTPDHFQSLEVVDRGIEPQLQVKIWHGSELMVLDILQQARQSMFQFIYVY